MVCLEPIVGDANANGFIAVWVLPGGVIQNADLPTTYAALGDEDHAPYLWGLKPWQASNQTPWCGELVFKSSRNLQSGARIVLQVNVAGLTTGSIQINTIQTMFTSNVK